MPWRKPWLAALALLSTQGAALAAPLTLASDATKILFSGGVDPATNLLRGSPALTAIFPDNSQGSFIMDTGSSGMVVYGSEFSHPAGATPLYRDVVQAYKSDNLLFKGDVYTTSVVIGNPGNSVTASVPVLYAREQRCADSSRHCSLKTSLRFMGVGFGQPPDGYTSWPSNLDTTQRNPLFNITEINGLAASPSKGWIMSSDGITVGLTSANTSGFAPDALEQLTTSTDGFSRGSASVVASLTGEPTPPPGVVDGRFNGTVLVDSGVRYAMMVLSSESTQPHKIHCPERHLECTDAGYTITVYLGNPSAPLVYQIATGPDGPTTASPDAAAAPDFVNQLGDTPPFWNTSFHFYNAYNYLFDSGSGQVGYRSATAVPAPPPLLASAAAFGWARRLRRRRRGLTRQG